MALLVCGAQEVHVGVVEVHEDGNVLCVFLAQVVVVVGLCGYVCGALQVKVGVAVWVVGIGLKSELCDESHQEGELKVLVV